MKAPRRGNLSPSITLNRTAILMIGMITPASTQKTEGRLVSLRGSFTDEGAGFCSEEGRDTSLLSFENEVGSQQFELGDEVLVPPADDTHVADCGTSLGAERGDEVAEAAAKVGNDDVGAVEGRRAGDDRRVVEVALSEPARVSAEAVFVDLDGRAHLDESVNEAEPLLVDRLVHDRD